MLSDHVNGLVRPVSALMVIAALCIAFLAQVFGATAVDIKDAFIGVGGGILGWYFGKRDAEREGARAGATTGERPSSSR